MTMKRGRARGRPAGGSDAIVDAILATPLTRLEERGFEDLSVEEVARAAGVNKTSAYRRWPSKADLVLAAVGSVREAEPPFVESGDLRSDLVQLLEAYAARWARCRRGSRRGRICAVRSSSRGPLRRARGVRRNVSGQR